jgi:2-polyprenyl-3-methyl-5-hydroxy-6-metoxy-1,4-benzoquinol methylase
MPETPPPPELTPYDHVAYPCHAHRQTHPENLGAIARMCGVNAVEPSRCRVLEIGCGSGENLLPMAAQLPGATFFGVDLAETSIREAEMAAGAAGLTNIGWLAADLTKLNAAEHGQWDYIIAHGVFTWVPEVVRGALLRVCRELLSENGIAFISYNAFPGGHVRGMLREMLLYHVDSAAEPKVKINQGRALLKLLADGHRDTDEYGAVLRAEAARVMAFNPHHFYHDDLAEINQPYYVEQFAAMAASFGLSYVWDADFSAESESHLSPEVREVLSGLNQDPIRKAQYLDFIKCRRFRQTLLCRREAAQQTSDPVKRLNTLRFSCSAKGPQGSNQVPGEEEFRGLGDLTIRTADVTAKHMMRAMAEIWPGRLTWNELVVCAEGAPEATIAGILQELTASGAATAFLGAAPFAAALSERPVGSHLARKQLEHSATVTTLGHQTVEISDELGRWLLAHLDGTRTAEGLAQLLASQVNPELGEDPEVSLNEARIHVDTALQSLLGLHLLEA